MDLPDEIPLPKVAEDAEPPKPDHWFDKVFLIYVREPLLRPVLFVLVAHVIAFTAPLLLMALRDRRGFAAAGRPIRASLVIQSDPCS